jgi:histone H3/H4
LSPLPAEAAEAAAAAGKGDAAADEDAAAAAAAAAAPTDTVLPRGVVKRIMLLDPEVQRVSADAVWLAGEATRLFLQALAAKGGAAVSSKKRKTIMLQDFDGIVRCVCVCGGGGRGRGGRAGCNKTGQACLKLIQ